MDPRVFARLNLALILFLSLLVLVFWPERQTAGLSRPHQFDLGYALTFLLAVVFTTILAAGSRPRALLLLLVSTIPISLLLYFAGMMPLLQLGILYASALLCQAGFWYFTSAVSPAHWAAVPAVLYFSGLAGVMLLYGLGWQLAVYHAGFTAGITAVAYVSSMESRTDEGGAGRGVPRRL